MKVKKSTNSRIVEKICGLFCLLFASLLVGLLGGLRRLGFLLLFLLSLLFLVFLALNCVVYFSSMNRYLLRRRDTKTDLIPSDINYDNLNIIADHNRLISLSA